MTYSEIDWLVTWKLFHWEFCWIYLALGTPIRLILARRFETTLQRKILYLAVSNITLSLASTWFPVIPVIAGSLLTFLAGNPRGESLLISVPVVAVSLGTETSVIDAALLRLLLKSSVKPRLAALFIANLVNAILAVVLGLLWAVRHMPTFEAALN